MFSALEDNHEAVLWITSFIFYFSFGMFFLLVYKTKMVQSNIKNPRSPVPEKWMKRIFLSMFFIIFMLFEIFYAESMISLEFSIRSTSVSREVVNSIGLGVVDAVLLYLINGFFAIKLPTKSETLKLITSPMIVYFSILYISIFLTRFLGKLRRKQPSQGEA